MTPKILVFSSIIVLSFSCVSFGQVVNNSDKPVITSVSPSQATEEVHREYFSNGKVSSETQMHNGVPEGRSVFYYENGVIQQESFYKEGKMEGTTKVYDEKGMLRNKQEFHDNVVISQNLYDVKGNLIDAVALEAIHQGFQFYNNKQFNEAEAEFTKAIGINSNLADAYSDRGNVYVSKGELDKAIEDFTRAIEVDSSYAESYNGRGSAYDTQGKHEEAIADFTKAIEINPKGYEGYYNRGITYQTIKKLPEAFADFTKVIELNPNFAQAYYNRAIIENIQGQTLQEANDALKAKSLGLNVDQLLKEVKAEKNP